MTNRRTQDSDYLADSDDNLIGLTSAFPPVKGPQSVEYDKNDNAIGLTGAFAPIPDQNEPHAWDEAGKWKDFDWSAYESSADGDVVPPIGEEMPEAAALEEPVDEVADANAGAAQEQVVAAAATSSTAAKSTAAPARGSGRGRHAAPDASMSPRMQQSRKHRRTLVVLVVLVVVVIVAVAFFTVRTFSNSQEEAAHQAQEQMATPTNDMGGQLSDGAGNAPTKLTDVPNLTSVLGMTTDEALAAIGHGAVVTANRPVAEEGNPIKANVSVALTEEPDDSKTGVPTVYFGLDQDGKIIQVGYSASASALGFGSLSFADAINQEHVIEKTLAKIGVNVPEGSAALPADKSTYSTYASDGTTVTRERCSFEGDVDVNGVPCTWSSVLSYDYTTQVVTGDLADTVRIIYVYLTKK